MGRSHRLSLAVASAAVLAACSYRPPPALSLNADLTAAESVYADLRDLNDRIQVGIEGGRIAADSLGALIRFHNMVREQVVTRLAAVDSSVLDPEDARALRIMRRTLVRDLAPVSAPEPAVARGPEQPNCTYDAVTLARRFGLDSLRHRIYACYSWAQSHVAVPGDTTDRLSVLGSLGRTESPERRRQLFLALSPLWRSVNGDNTPASPYRQLIAAEVARLGGETVAAGQALASGVPPDSLEPWLLSVLDTWRAVTPDSMSEPWDWYYETGRASRFLSGMISRERLSALNRAVFRSLGADPARLGVWYDLEPRDGKTPVAFCTFGARPRLINGAWRPGEPWVFATYRSGGLDNLNELLHETGHAVHLAAIRTRPSFADWPDSDPFTEAVADFTALDVYEPAWQQHWLGDSVPLADGLRSRYGPIVLDVAWALFELRMQRNPAGDPNRVWTSLTHDYLRIRPHPELSWWAMRGQLVDSPGYMMNYAIGSILIAAIRERTRQLHGPFATGDPSWYAWVAPRLFRFGLARPARRLLEEFLGGPVSPAALLLDLRRMRGL